MNNELLSIISYLERDRGVDREIIIQAIESAIQQAARKSLEVTNDLRVEIDRTSLSIKAFDTVVASDEDEGFGFVTMSSEEEAQKAMEELNGQEVDGRPINVSEAREQSRERRPFGDR